MRAKFLVPILGATLTALTACSSPSTTPPSPPTPLVARVMSHCTDVAAPTLGEGTLCIDNGFRLRRDDFSFANWGRSSKADDNVTTQTLIDLFGYDTVCVPGAETECVMRPSAVQLLDLWNTALAGGRCEGLAALSTRFFMALEEPATFAQRVSQPSQLSSRDPDVTEAVVYWWSTQFIDEVSRAASDSRLKSPLQLVDELIQGLSHSLGQTLGLYYATRGHSVTPFAVTQRPDSFVIHVYDNNFPGKRREILVNKATDTWTYVGAMTRVDGAVVDWSGARGSLELTSMSARQGPFTCPFCKVPTEDTPTSISLASRDPKNPGFLRVTSRKGTAEMTPNGFSTTITDAKFSVSKGAGGLATVTLPADVVDFDVEIVRQSSDVPAGDVLVNVDRPGFARLQLSGNLATNPANSDITPILSARKNDMKVVAPPQASLAVSLARHGTLATQTLSANEELEMSRVTDRTITISVKGTTMESSVDLLVAPSDTSERVEISRNENNSLILNAATPTSVRARAARTANFIPAARAPQRSTTTTSTTVASIEISEPD